MTVPWHRFSKLGDFSPAIASGVGVGPETMEGREGFCQRSVKKKKGARESLRGSSTESRLLRKEMSVLRANERANGEGPMDQRSPRGGRNVVVEMDEQGCWKAGDDQQISGMETLRLMTRSRTCRCGVWVAK